MGGGVLLIAVMGNVFSPAVLIPLHGVIQLGSNATRAAVLWKDIRLSICIPFALGAAIGATVASQVVLNLPEKPYRFSLAILILVLTWMPNFKNAPKVPHKFFFLGCGATFLSFFVGATGPLTAPFYLRENLAKKVLVATKAAAQVFIHSMKVGAFFLLGFSFSPYWKLLVWMLIAATLGTFVGKFLLERLSQQAFRVAFKVVVTLLAIRMIAKAYLL